MFISLQHKSAANLTLDTSTAKCIMLQRIKLVATLQPGFGPDSLLSTEPLSRRWHEENIH